MIFLLIIGILLDTEPLYVKGPHDPVLASAGCYSAAGIYAGTLGASVIYWILHETYVAGRNFVSSRNHGNRQYGGVNNWN